MSWSGCGDCSRRKFYQPGYEDGLKESEKELQELREYKSRVEKFISKYDGLVMSEKKDKIKELEEELKWYKENYNEVCDIVYKIKNAFIPGYYVTDSCNGTRACEIISDKIIEDFAPKKKINWGCWFPECMK